MKHLLPIMAACLLLACKSSPTTNTTTATMYTVTIANPAPCPTGDTLTVKVDDQVFKGARLPFTVQLTVGLHQIGVVFGGVIYPPVKQFFVDGAITVDAYNC